MTSNLIRRRSAKIARVWRVVTLVALGTSTSLFVHSSTGRRSTLQRRAQAEKQPHVANVDGDFYVDHTCIDCDTCRWMAPDTFGRTAASGPGQSYVYRQPVDTQVDLAVQAMVSCPTGSIRTRTPQRKTPEVIDNFPLLLSEHLPNVYHLGFHSKDSFGAASYFVKAGSIEKPLNIMIDSPRYSSKLANRLSEMGGVHLMVLSHKDDVADHNRWKERFPEMQRVLHHSEVRSPEAFPYSDMKTIEEHLQGEGPWTLADGIKILLTPGHTSGSITLILDGQRTGGDPVAFTGDSLALSGRLGRLDGFARYSDDVQLQAASIEKLANEDFLWILPGHGRRVHFLNAAERMERLLTASETFKRDPHGTTAPGPLFHVKNMDMSTV